MPSLEKKLENAIFFRLDSSCLCNVFQSKNFCCRRCNANPKNDAKAGAANDCKTLKASPKIQTLTTKYFMGNL